MGSQGSDLRWAGLSGKGPQVERPPLSPYPSVLERVQPAPSGGRAPGAGVAETPESITQLRGLALASHGGWAGGRRDRRGGQRMQGNAARGRASLAPTRELPGLRPLLPA